MQDDNAPQTNNKIKNVDLRKTITQIELSRFKFRSATSSMLRTTCRLASNNTPQISAIGNLATSSPGPAKPHSALQTNRTPN